MNLGQITNVLASIVTVALVFVIVSNKNTSGIITAGGNAFTGGLRAAMGH